MSVCHGLMKFQFHNGSIKGKLRLPIADHLVVSIPQWFD